MSGVGGGQPKMRDTGSNGMGGKMPFSSIEDGVKWYSKIL